jgi:NAD dependent epimerase/dehydratase family enzyme
MKIILLGSNGMLGSYLRSYLSDKYELLPLTRNDIDLSTSESDIISYLDKITNEGDIIINSAGVIKQRDYNVKDMIMLNSIVTTIIITMEIEIIITCITKQQKSYLQMQQSHHQHPLPPSSKPITAPWSTCL